MSQGGVGIGAAAFNHGFPDVTQGVSDYVAEEVLRRSIRTSTSPCEIVLPLFLHAKSDGFDCWSSAYGKEFAVALNPSRFATYSVANMNTLRMSFVKDIITTVCSDPARIKFAKEVL
jgi:hypothetical protein